MIRKAIPNILTIFRIVATPIIIWFLLGFDNFYIHLVAFFLFLLASLSDLFDGIIARRLAVVSEFGKFMDPLADKILVNGTFITLNILDIVPVWITAIVVFRDAAVTMLRWGMLSQGQSMETSRVAKWKTTFQYISMYLGLLMVLLYHWPQLQDFVIWLEEWSFITTIFALTGIITAYTGAHYFWVNRKALKVILTQ
ncbi:MAG: CDP-diacylglycerol--glycerol-3-phosphate 3-phosphatidyltransferase [Candidatus Marinimicrobia bacterium CG1_02_48_14]|nr:MAG: CDP-diacylglycerol--glycerol-3-phosphate 3-phosphatidyltransferase [Candidatus Marinimicrobia bacterium CG1_02_48_14]PIZ65075.1 MAG: CDP-diacylglycerol--glycerol-3-phosphate 3-phosphatidyltransferase [Candidatus Marinimicrobia bacterium CG_4_10_14_0_2_um_filter_48_9]